MTSSLIRLIGLLAVLCAAWIFLRRRLRPAFRSPHRLTALSLGHGALLVQAHVDGRVFVLAVTRAGDVRLVDRRAETPAVRADATVAPFGPRSFAELIDRLRHRTPGGAAGGEAQAAVDERAQLTRVVAPDLRAAGAGAGAPRPWRLRRVMDGLAWHDRISHPSPPSLRRSGDTAGDGP